MHLLRDSPDLSLPSSDSITTSRLLQVVTESVLGNTVSVYRFLEQTPEHPQQACLKPSVTGRYTVGGLLGHKGRPLYLCAA